jgi:hypothetical protein
MTAPGMRGGGDAGMIHAGTQGRHDDARLVEPHRRLMVAVLQTVLDDCRGSAHRRKAGRGPGADPQGTDHAIAYTTSTDRVWPFSFENICEALGLDADSLRRELHKENGV